MATLGLEAGHTSMKKSKESFDPFFEKNKKRHDGLALLFRRLFKVGTGHLSEKDLKDMNIFWAPLDLNKGSAQADKPFFVSPFPIEKMDKALEITKPWQNRSMYERTREPTNLYAGMQLINYLLHYLLYSDEDNDGQYAFKHKTKWDTRSMDYDGGEFILVSNRSRPNGRDFRAEVMLDTFDRSVPHVGCFLTDLIGLQEDSFSFAEVFAVLAITNGRHRREDYQQHKIFPATLVSVSGRKARVIHGYVDEHGKGLHLWKSPIVDFEKKSVENTKLILSWAIGNPIGDTTW